MRLLIWHVDSFLAEPTERGRSKIADAAPKAVSVSDGLVVFAACEKRDEPEPEAGAERATAAVVEGAKEPGAGARGVHSVADPFVGAPYPPPAQRHPPRLGNQTAR